MTTIQGPNGRTFTIDAHGRKVDEDGFKTSSFSEYGDLSRWHCVAVKIDGDMVQVRDTKDPSKATLNYTRAEWAGFVRGVKVGEFDV
ncbi:MAG: DUF397 domain-containing protein [Candidatus Kaiserbacteria bacterium]|nr:MAG: DUF397 domain-containing protein [Candidatus Kaiserbacteria bacterium]